MTSLHALLDDDHRAATVAGLTELVNSTVSQQSGLTGLTLKGGLAAACKFDRQAVAKGLDLAFPDIVKAMETYWKTYQASVDCCFGMHLENDRQGVAGKLMTILDRHIENVDVPAMDKVYSACRAKGMRVLEGHVGEFGNLLEENLPAQTTDTVA
ncbi:DUF6918 family protein [Corynebacterium epidermidicanis]|uniref:DUF6918 family protein n=1 Tax=Corynebacterium epidermidicanis TaxID=1050174 RepID=UPI00118752E7|nr:hypothetical protein [Corynebacterium epidermidicanis]